MVESFVYYLVGGMIVFIGAIIWFGIMHEKKRTEALSRFALQSGLTITKFQKNYSVPQLDIFNRGHSRKSSNIMRGRINNITWAIFDYRYTTGSGKNSHTHRQTVAHTKFTQKIAAFHLGREHLGHKLIALIGFKDMNFDSHPLFSKKYHLKAKDEAVRKLFTVQILDYFERNDVKLTIEARGTDIIIYKKNKRVKPSNMRVFINQATEIVRLFESAQKNI